jgi:hypothetical protein
MEQEDNHKDPILKWFASYIYNQEYKFGKAPQKYGKYRCPCCRFYTLGESAAYEICYLCNWEDDGQNDPYANEVWGGPNGKLSLTQARNNFKELYSIKDLKEINEQPEVFQIKKTIMENFIYIEENPQLEKELLVKISELREKLYKNLRKKIMILELKNYLKLQEKRLELSIYHQHILNQTNSYGFGQG